MQIPRFARNDKSFTERSLLETHGPLGTIWVAFGLGCFYVALIWLNTLLGFFLTPLFIIPATWLQDHVMRRKHQVGA